MSDWGSALIRTIDAYTDTLKSLEAECQERPTFHPARLNRLTQATQTVLLQCQVYERTASLEDVSYGRTLFQRRTEHWAFESFIVSRTRHWPRGYQADFLTLDTFYQATPCADRGLGLLFDLYLLASPLGRAFRERRLALRELLRGELATRLPAARVLSWGCGSCREFAELGGDVRAQQALYLGVDEDEEALAYAQRLLLSWSLPAERVEFFPAPRLQLQSDSSQRIVIEPQDIIYLPQQCDLLPDSSLTKLLHDLYALLRPGGRLILPFFDRHQFDTANALWLTRWTGLVPRCEDDVVRLCEQAAIPASALRLSHDRSGANLIVVVSR